MRACLIALFALWGSLATAQDTTPLVSLETGDASRGWEAVGRLDIAGQGFCTAALIREKLILTAAHCVYGRNGQMLDASRFEFHAGLRAGRADASRSVTRIAAHPDFIYSGATALSNGVAMDIAVLELDRPIRLSRVEPFDVASDANDGDEVGVVSYGRGRPNAASLQEVCEVLGRQVGVVVMTCDVEPGSSGSPVFTIRNGKPHIVSVVSSMSSLGSEKVALGTSLNEPLTALLKHFESIGPANPGGTQRLIMTGQRNETGAKFVRP